jgi:hypothetical protein
VGGRHDVRVLEPSPPAVNEPPFFADDPAAGGLGGVWAMLCADDPDLREWCEDRWLVLRPLAPLPPRFAETRAALHALAEHVIVPCRHAANGKIGLRYTYRGFGTPFFGADRQVRVEDGVVLDNHGVGATQAGHRRHELTTLRAAAQFLDVAPVAPTGVYTPTTACDLDAPLTVDPAAARALGDWFGFTAHLLEGLRAEAGDQDNRVQLWPEHFDLAVTLDQPRRSGTQPVNYGGSPGDAEHPEPYLYIGPWDGPPADRTGRADERFWNEPFGASLSYQQLLAGADPVAFLTSLRRAG